MEFCIINDKLKINRVGNDLDFRSIISNPYYQIFSDFLTFQISSVCNCNQNNSQLLNPFLRISQKLLKCQLRKTKRNGVHAMMQTQKFNGPKFSVVHQNRTFKFLFFANFQNVSQKIVLPILEIVLLTRIKSGGFRSEIWI